MTKYVFQKKCEAIQLKPTGRLFTASSEDPVHNAHKPQTARDTANCAAMSGCHPVPFHCAGEVTSRGGSAKATQHATTSSGWWLTYPSEKYESQGLFFPIYGKIIQMFQTTNQSLKRTPPPRIRRPWHKQLLAPRRHNGWVQAMQQVMVGTAVVQWS